jgi:dihydrofolate reductase
MAVLVFMSLVTCHMTISLDGFVAGAVQTREDPIGEGHRLHQWMFRADESGHEADARLREQIVGGRGAFVMGRNMYGPIRGEWGDEDWQGWWGEEPPYHVDAFVLTHHSRAPLPMKGGTTFHFVTDGAESALEQAKRAAGGRDVRVGGGVSTIRQYLTSRLIDEMHLVVRPVFLGAGEKLFDGLDLKALGYETARTVAGERAFHVFVKKASTTPAS